MRASRVKLIIGFGTIILTCCVSPRYSKADESAESSFMMVIGGKSSDKEKTIINIRFINDAPYEVLIDKKAFDAAAINAESDKKIEKDGSTTTFVTNISEMMSSGHLTAKQTALDASRTLWVKPHLNYDCSLDISASLVALRKKFPDHPITLKISKKGIMLNSKSNIDPELLFSLKFTSNTIVIP